MPGRDNFFFLIIVSFPLATDEDLLVVEDSGRAPEDLLEEESEREESEREDDIRMLVCRCCLSSTPRAVAFIGPEDDPESAESGTLRVFVVLR